MKGFFAMALLAVLLLAGCTQSQNNLEVSNMKLESNDFEKGQPVPSQFTCDGQNISPELHWFLAPEGTKSFALSLRDPDAPSGDFVHWLVCNIPTTTTAITQNSVPENSTQVKNDFGKTGYGGPCPPSGTHRYFFRIYALDTESINPNAKQDFFQLVEQHKIGEAELMATYQRK
jgi:hypothetical protein